MGCYKRGTVRWVFPRVDKLTDHIRNSHHHDTPFADCPVNGCVFRPCALDVLDIHVKRAHPNSKC